MDERYFVGQSVKIIMVMNFFLDCKKSQEISAFDEKRKVARNEKVHKAVDKFINQIGLRPEYQEQLIKPELEDNLTASQKSIVEAYKAQIENLKAIQDADDIKKNNIEQIKSIVQATVETANRDISQKMNSEDFYPCIEPLFETTDDINIIAEQVKNTIWTKASEIAKAEEAIRQEAIIKEQERIAKEAAIREKAENVIPSDDKPVIQQEQYVQPVVVAPVQASSPQNPFHQSFEERWEGKITLSGTTSGLNIVLSALKQLCSENDVTLAVTETNKL